MSTACGLARPARAPHGPSKAIWVWSEHDTDVGPGAGAGAWIGMLGLGLGLAVEIGSCVEKEHRGPSPNFCRIVIGLTMDQAHFRKKWNLKMDEGNGSQRKHQKMTHHQIKDQVEGCDPLIITCPDPFFCFQGNGI